MFQMFHFFEVHTRTLDNWWANVPMYYYFLIIITKIIRYIEKDFYASTLVDLHFPRHAKYLRNIWNIWNKVGGARVSAFSKMEQYKTNLEQYKNKCLTPTHLCTHTAQQY